MMFHAYLTTFDRNRVPRIDLSAPVSSGSNLTECVARAFSVREGYHAGVIVFDPQMWEFTDFVSFDEFESVQT